MTLIYSAILHTEQQPTVNEITAIEMHVAMSSTEVKLEQVMSSTEVKLEEVTSSTEVELEQVTSSTEVEVTSSTRVATESSRGQKWKSDLHRIRNVPERE